MLRQLCCGGAQKSPPPSPRDMASKAGNSVAPAADQRCNQRVYPIDCKSSSTVTDTKSMSELRARRHKPALTIKTGLANLQNKLDEYEKLKDQLNQNIRESQSLEESGYYRHKLSQQKQEHQESIKTTIIEGFKHGNLVYADLVVANLQPQYIQNIMHILQEKGIEFSI